MNHFPEISNPNSLFMEMSDNTNLKQVFLTPSDDDHLFIFLLDFCITSLLKYLFKSFAHFKLFFFFLLFTIELYEFFIYQGC